MRLLLALLLCAVCCICHAQDKPYELGLPLGIREVGVNKVLCMKNGNTLLFHFERMKRILVKVFDGSHREVASRQDKYREVDLSLIEYATFKGLYEIGGEAVLFLDQDLMGKHCLLMLRYNATTGRLIEERLVGESKSENKRIKYYVMKHRQEKGYEILFVMDKRHPKQNDMFIVYFNERHEAVKELQLEIDRKKYDYLDIVGAESRPNGVLITIGLDKPIIYGRATNMDIRAFGVSDHDSALVEGGPVSDHFLAFYYIPDGSREIKRGFVNVTESIFPYYSLYTYNPFAGAINLLLYSQKPYKYLFGILEMTGILSRNLFFKIDPEEMATEVTALNNRMANEASRRQADTTRNFEGMPMKMFTNENGLSTLVSQAFVRYGEPETHARYDYQDYLGNICVTQFDDNGNEIWGTVLPLAQYYNSNRQYLNERELCMRWQDQQLFGDWPVEVYNRQFISFNTYSNGKDLYIIYNDYNKNFKNSLARPGDTVYSFSTTNAVYYKVDRKKTVTKHYLYGEPAVKEYKSSFIEGADYDEERRVYASLVRYRKHNKTTLRMAWRRLD